MQPNAAKKALLADKVVPYTVFEWKKVTRLIRSSKIDDLDVCYNYIQMWCSRMGTNTPVAISCTASCLSCSLKEQKLRNPIELEQLKLQFSMAIIRFINYIAEGKRTSNDEKTSIYGCAEKAGIPRWIVEIRHEASHNHIPPLATLKRANDLCMEYLWKEFWSKPMHEALAHIQQITQQTMEDEDTTAISTKLTNDIENVLNEFFGWRVNNLTTENYEKVGCIVRIQKLLRQNGDAFLSIFVRPGFLILTVDQAKMSYYSIVAKWEIPDFLKRIWAPIFSMLMDANLSIIFVMQLFNVKISSAQKDFEVIEWQAVAWLNEILKRSVTPDSTLFKENEWVQILQKMVQAPEGFSPSLVERVMIKMPNSDKKMRRQVRKMLDITLTDSVMEESEFNYADETQIYTAADLERLIEKKNRKHEVGQKFGVFTVMDPMDEQIPLQMGLAPGQKYESVSLVIDDDWLESNDLKSQSANNSMLDTIMEEDSQRSTFYGDTSGLSYVGGT